jgi:lipopolysaccharide/colanic/teichoic acid biosynthesis glycosyltransferase
MYTIEFLNETDVQPQILTKKSPAKSNKANVNFDQWLTNSKESYLDYSISQLYELNPLNKQFPAKRGYEFTKRAIDLAFCLIFGPLALLLIFLFGILIKLDSKGPMFYKQVRCGKKGKFYSIYKLRSMIDGAEKSCGATWASKDDPRITTIGKIIRKTRIDELPQLWNIFTGDMSMIGPRPERPELILEFSEKHISFISRNYIKPGVTGWAQINGGYELSPKEKLTYDIYYIKNRNIFLDAYIMLRTVWVVLTAHGAY